jgi:hypothetical protein
MKTLLQVEAEFQAAAHSVVHEKNLLVKAQRVDALINRLAAVVQVVGAEIRSLKNKVEGV